ncbi:lauroyl acyltransferase [Afifella sp. JA880]|nr:lauroyl acyltransferase [Afifella sp. JA880]
MTSGRSLSPTRRARYFAEYALMRLVAVLLRSLPIDVASNMMGRAWSLVGPRTHRHPRVMQNLAIAFPEKSESERQEIARQQWDNLGRTFAESFLIDLILASDRVTIDIDPKLRQSFVDRGAGLLVVGLHSANWEIASIAIPKELNGIGLYQRLKNPYSDAYVTSLRSNVFPGGLIAKAKSTPRRVMAHVRAGGAVALLGDQREAKGIKVVVFGKETTANPFPAMVARRLHNPVVAGRVIRGKGARFIVQAKVLECPQTGNQMDDVAVFTQTIQTQFETWIRERPGEWMWVHDRWKSARVRS